MWRSGPQPATAIDGRLRNFLSKCQDFFTWFEAGYATRREQAARLLRRLDPLALPLPGPIEELQVEELQRHREYFEGVCHHIVDAQPDDFSSWQSAFERFLLDRLIPRTFEDHAHLDEIIREGEQDAKS
jgi:hypothetical protein